MQVLSTRWIPSVRDSIQWHTSDTVLVYLRVFGKAGNISCQLSTCQVFKSNPDDIASSEVISRVIRERKAAEHGRCTN